ncbi:hypothetical protein AB0N73_08850 [Microbacterium sp. NPDC089189]|uniref:hypothetical protein n=1 Tax=Microbacterium sp. NPDC089189 TaxID=3154972 RepID=UPI0034334379
MASPLDDAAPPRRSWPAVAIAGAVLLLLPTAVIAIVQAGAGASGMPVLAAWFTYGFLPAAALFVLAPAGVAAVIDGRRRRQEATVRDTLIRRPAPTETIIDGDPHVGRENDLVHAYRTAASTGMDPVLHRRVALGIARHLRRHSPDHYPVRPIGFHVVLANGASLGITDMALPGTRRVLQFHSDRVTPGFTQVIGAIGHPRGVPDDAPWFGWSTTPREQRSAMRRLEIAADTAYRTRSLTVAEHSIAIDPLTEPRTVPRDAVERMWDAHRPVSP